MKCFECGREVRNINFKHLKSCSNLTPQEYREKHSGADLVDPEVKKSFGLPLERNPNWKGGRSYRSCGDCGKQLSPNNKSDQCSRCARLGTKNPFFGRKHTDDTRKKMALSARLRDPATYNPGKLSSETISRVQRRYWSRIPPAERAGRLTSFIESGQRYNKKSSKTKIENSMASVLSELGLVYERNVQIGRYNVDFLIKPKTIIECFGDYWHCNPMTYESDFYHRSLHITAEEKWQRDSGRRKELEAQGYIFYVFWEHDIKNDLVRVKEELFRFFSVDGAI
jgi:very-short-patch-repair endonuclease